MLLAFAFFVSGTAGLIYQVVWSRLLVLVFGSTTLAVITVLSPWIAAPGGGDDHGGRS
jgi:spermidine synthase